MKTWELLFLCASAMPPGKEYGVHLSKYVHGIAIAPGDYEIQRLAMNTWNALKRSVKGGPRRTTPAEEEIEALFEGRKLITTAYFLDDTFEEITYDVSTTVADAVEVSNFLDFNIVVVAMSTCYSSSIQIDALAND